MYNVKLTGLEKDAIRRGDSRLLLKKLEESDQNLIRDLKKRKGDVSYLQGASHIIDTLIELLKVP